jgi:DnaK suppressor protein
VPAEQPELTDEQLDELAADLRDLKVSLESALADLVDGTKPVDLDEPIGRLSRMEAMQQQSMATASRRNFETRLEQSSAAIGRLTRGDYGECLECEEPIGYRRLKARPESRLCLNCQSSREAR